MPRPKKSFLQELERAIELCEEFGFNQLVKYDRRGKRFVFEDLVREVLREHPEVMAIEILDGDPEEAANWYQPLPVLGWAICQRAKMHDRSAPLPAETPETPPLTPLEKLDALAAIGNSRIR